MELKLDTNENNPDGINKVLGNFHTVNYKSGGVALSNCKFDYGNDKIDETN